MNKDNLVSIEQSIENIIALKKKYIKRRDNLKESMQKMKDNASLDLYDYFDGSRMTYNLVIADLEKLLK